MAEIENNLPPPDTLCIVCKNQCILECVKCQKCKQSVHTDCTRLPVYAIVNFFNTRCQYTCEECVRKQLGEAVDHQFAVVYTLIEKEEAAKQSNKDENIENSGAEADDDRENDSMDHEASHLGLEKRSANWKTPMNENDRENGSVDHETSNLGLEKRSINRKNPTNENQDNESKSRKVCYFYKNNRCKYGRRGKGCHYAHPGLCYKYQMHGRDNIKGCRKERCPYLHPPVCYGSERKRECFNLECKRLHLKGTRRYPLDEAAAKSQQSVNDPTPVPQPQTRPVTSHDTSTRGTENSPLIFLMRQVQQMQQVQNHIMEMLKVVPWQWGPPAPLQKPLQHMGPAPTMTTYH